MPLAHRERNRELERLIHAVHVAVPLVERFRGGHAAHVVLAVALATARRAFPASGVGKHRLVVGAEGGLDQTLIALTGERLEVRVTGAAVESAKIADDAGGRGGAVAGAARAARAGTARARATGSSCRR